MEDTEISRLISERSESGLAELKQKHWRLILKVCRGILKSPEDAEECANDALYAVWESIAREDPVDLTAFVCKIARRKALNRLRYNLAPIRNSDLLIELNEIYYRTDISSDETSPEEYAERAELAAVINEWLGTLPERQRILFMRRYFFFDSVKDAGKACRMTANAAGAALCRLRGQLKNFLTEKADSRYKVGDSIWGFSSFEVIKLRDGSDCAVCEGFADFSFNGVKYQVTIETDEPTVEMTMQVLEDLEIL